MTNYTTMPRLRERISYELVGDGDEKTAIIFDPEGYIIQPVYMPEQMLEILEVFDGTTRVEDFVAAIKSTPNGNQFDFESFFSIMDFLDKSGFFETEYFQNIKVDVDAYNSSPVRPAVCAGNTYESEPEALRLQLDELLSSPNGHSQTAPKAVAVPHIDFRIGDAARDVYSSVYNALRHTDADLFVILGTSHYSNDALFMTTGKDYGTPLGVVETDKPLLAAFKEKIGMEWDNYDLAHRFEHSIELQAVLLRHIFPDRKFTVLPILCGSFHDYMQQSIVPDTEQFFRKFTSSLRDAIAESGRKTCIIASGDFSHVGKRFDDSMPASALLGATESIDKEYLSHLVNCDKNGFYSAIANSQDVSKVCGMSPFYTMLSLAEPTDAELLSYGVWDDQETESAVTFAGIAYR